MKYAMGTFGKFFKKRLFSPPMLLVENDTVAGKDKTYLFEKNPDPELIKELSKMEEGAFISIEYYHLNEDNDVRVIKSIT